MMHRTRPRWLIPANLLLAAVATFGLSALLSPSRAAELDKKVVEAENKRIAAIEKVKPSVCAIFAPGFNNGGSGVLISEDGYALTNFHVTSACGNFQKVGLPDGKLYDAVLVGQDKVGDVALIKLLPKKEGDKFPHAPLGDSDKVKAGDWSLAMGNPFLLATDFSPTVTFGLVSGVHRYQYPAGILLEYADCIQIDTSINPGNSGGPLFNLDGELIGINGRGSFEKRGRVNSGVGYAISINQIKNFMGQLRAGLDTDHASLGATIASSEDDQVGKYIVNSIIESDAKRRGLELGDQIVSFAGRPIGSVNQFKNALGIYPRGWRLPMIYRRGDERREVLVRLMGVQRQEVGPGDPMAPPQPPPGPPQPKVDSPASKYFEAKPGFANHYFNRQERDKLLKAVKDNGDFSKLTGAWTITANATVKGKKAADGAKIEILPEGARDKTSPKIKASIAGIDYDLEPISPETKDDVTYPPASGGFLMAIFQWHELLVKGEVAFKKEFAHGGTEPFYLPPPEKGRPDFAKLRRDCDVLRTESFISKPSKFYFDPKTREMLGFEMLLDKETADPCEVYFSNYKKVASGQLLPHTIEIWHADKQYAVLDVTSYEMK
jgi:S1-C subfamily serine protease